ncbi:hypothetical protein N9L02_01285 [Gammaproteobacteria bacterium]|nr:hypothetical protein [Gammaproteobacteria bacterium]
MRWREWRNQTIKYTLAIALTTMYFLAASLAITGLCMSIALIANFSVHSAFLSAILYSTTFFVATFNNTYQNVLLKLDTFLPRILPMFRNPLLQQIDNLNTKENIDFLNANELFKIKKSMTTKEQKDNLEKYLNYTKNDCCISLTPIIELKNPITIEGISTTNNKTNKWANTYEKESMREWIETKGIYATEPIVGCKLLSEENEIRIHQGFADWVYVFIKSMRKLIKPNPNQNFENEHKFNEEIVQHRFLYNPKTNPTSGTKNNQKELTFYSKIERKQ